MLASNDRQMNLDQRVWQSIFQPVAPRSWPTPTTIHMGVHEQQCAIYPVEFVQAGWVADFLAAYFYSTAVIFAHLPDG